MSHDLEHLKDQIPYYLTSEDQKALVHELEAFRDGSEPSFYLSQYNDRLGDGLLQGDGWRGFELFVFETGQKRIVRGIVLSNSCDVSEDNDRAISSNVIFAPLVKLSVYQKLLKESGLDHDRVDAKIASIKSQRTTNMFYLRSDDVQDDDYIVRLDNIYSMPMKAHIESDNRERLFRLNMTGFYLFVLKLSVHFCRLQENVKRSVTA